MQELEARLGREVGALFQLSPHGKHVRIGTPLCYPDGEVIDVFVGSDGADLWVSDLGETRRWAHMQDAQVGEVGRFPGVRLRHGMLETRVPANSSLAAAVLHVAQAAVHVAAVAVTRRWLAETAVGGGAQEMDNAR